MLEREKKNPLNVTTKSESENYTQIDSINKEQRRDMNTI